jgi:hypothetical protein
MPTFSEPLWAGYGEVYCTPLIVAAQAGRAEVAQLLLMCNATADGVDLHGRTSMHWLSLTSLNLDATRVAVRASSDNDEREKQFASVVQTLLDSKADCNLRDYDGYTPLELRMKALHAAREWWMEMSEEKRQIENFTEGHWRNSVKFGNMLHAFDLFPICEAAVHRLRRLIAAECVEERRYAGATFGFNSKVVQATSWSEVNPKRTWPAIHQRAGPVLRGPYKMTADGPEGVLSLPKEIHYLDTYLREGTLEDVQASQALQARSQANKTKLAKKKPSKLVSLFSL